ncbi:oligosaccharide flippase family protein [Lactiplantibacillus plantarum]|uniref:oligosaccharide flippase family protein n=1 Tax=Lactiplantibacillus plantarum TaxID=1590 RepID=UPI0021F78ED1|nr:oligosaccharide flippase family protein [Lactiplantibacillus plantarum]MCW0154623.1 oligosaccharide flippase family protein [Lactiplantibacillus plantarum]
MKLVKNFLWNAGYQVFVLLVPLITIPYVSRVLGPTGVGINSFTNSVVQYFILFGSLGITTYGNREIAYQRDSPEKLSQTFWEIALLRFFSIFISIICYLIFVILSHQYQTFYLIQGIMLIGAAFDISWFFMGMENFKVTVLRNALVKILSLILIFTMVKSASDTGVYILILASSQTIGYITLWPYVRKTVNFVPFRKLNLVRHLAPSVALLIPQIATQIYLQLNKTMLGTFRGVEASGFYDNSDKIIKMVLAIVTATGTVLLPHVAHSFANGDHAAVKRSLVTSMHVILVLAFPMAFGLAAVAKPFTLIFFGNKFASVGSLMAVESAVIVLIGISNAIGIQYLLPTNQLSAYTASVVLGSVVNVVLNVPLILVWGTMGAIVATVISEATVSIYQIYRIRNQILVHSLFEGIWKYALSAFAMFMVITVVAQLLSPGIFGVMVEVLVGIVAYVAILFMLQPKELFGYIVRFRKK